MDFALILILLLVCTLFGINTKFQKALYFIFAMLFSVIFATRPDTSPDTTEYIHIFQSVQTYDNWFSGFERYEVGFCILIRLIKVFTEDYSVLFFAVSIINYTLYFIVLSKIINEIKKQGIVNCYHYYLPILALYTSYYGLLYNAIAMRAGLAISFLYLSLILAYQRKVLLALLSIVVSFFFHQTAILALPLLFILYFRVTFTRQISLLLLLFSFIIYIFNIRNLTSSIIPFIADNLYNRFPDITILWWISHYTEGDLVATGSISAYMLFCFVLGYILICNVQNNLISGTYTTVYLLGIILYSLFGSYSLIVRYAEYFFFSICFVLGGIVSYNQNIRLTILTSGLVLKKNIFLLFSIIVFYLLLLRNSVQII